MKEVTVEVVTIKDIRDKELKYLVIKNGENKVIISVGEKTYNGVKALLNGEQKTTTQTKIQTDRYTIPERLQLSKEQMNNEKPKK